LMNFKCPGHRNRENGKLEPKPSRNDSVQRQEIWVRNHRKPSARRGGRRQRQGKARRNRKRPQNDWKSRKRRGEEKKRGGRIAEDKVGVVSRYENG